MPSSVERVILLLTVGQIALAEIAFAVEEDYQGLSIASILMRHLVKIVRQNGLSQLEAGVLGRNLSMLAVLRRSRLPITLWNQGDSVHVTLSLLPVTE
jgi:GNAT superfamily N-acetyltransferase